MMPLPVPRLQGVAESDLVAFLVSTLALSSVFLAATLALLAAVFA